jgi:hypothetical protein
MTEATSTENRLEVLKVHNVSEVPKSLSEVPFSPDVPEAQSPYETIRRFNETPLSRGHQFFIDYRKGDLDFLERLGLEPLL